jgi:PAS domain-containing protein
MRTLALVQDPTYRTAKAQFWRIRPADGYIARSNDILRYANSAFCRLVSKSKDELTGKPFVEVLPREGSLHC